MGPHLEIRTDGITDLKLPLSILKNAKLASIDGLAIMTEQHGVFTIESLSAKQIGYPNFDMRKWPLYILGTEPKNESKKFIDEVNQTRLMLNKYNNPYKQGSFKTSVGTGFISLGEQKTTVYLTDIKQKDLITIITTTNMKTSDIDSILLQGVL